MVCYSPKQKDKDKDKLPRSQQPLIPEPRHRVPPKGVSSGISFRYLPAPSLCAIRKICEHYEAKCSGQYSSLASRYVLQMGTEIKTQINGIEKNLGDDYNIQNGEGYYSDPVSKDIDERLVEDQSMHNLSKELSLGALAKKVIELKRALIETKSELKEAKENTAKELEAQMQEYKEKIEVDRLHYKNSQELMESTHKSELKQAESEIVQVKNDARLVIDFIRRKANEALEEVNTKNKNDKKQMTENMQSLEHQMKQNFNRHLQNLEGQVRNVVREEKIVFQTELTRASKRFKTVSLSPKRESKIPKHRDVSLQSNVSVIEEVFSDDSISTDDTLENVAKENKSNFHEYQNQLLRFRIKQLEQWTDTLTIALRNGAMIKGIGNKYTTQNEEMVVDSNKRSGEQRSPQKLNNMWRNEYSSNHLEKSFQLIPPSPPPVKNIIARRRWNL